jgi:hypothetical protein
MTMLYEVTSTFPLPCADSPCWVGDGFSAVIALGTLGRATVRIILCYAVRDRVHSYPSSANPLKPATSPSS